MEVGAFLLARLFMPLQAPRLRQVGAYVREIAVFAVAFVCVLMARTGGEVTPSTPASTFWDSIWFGGVTFALGAVPWPRTRKMTQVTVGSFLANWTLLAWYSWVLAALLLPYSVETWPYMAQELLSFEVIAFSSGAAASAAAGYALSRRFLSRSVRAPEEQSS